MDADDALARSKALGRARAAIDSGAFQLPEVPQPGLLSEGMTLDAFRQTNRGFTLQFLHAFVAFLAKGRFKFGWDS